MSHAFAVKWLKAFREGPEAVVALYADEFFFEDPILGQSAITSREELLRICAPYANTDPGNGVGIHNFHLDEVIGDDKAAVYRWTWTAPTAADFLGVPTNGKVAGAQGITFHIYDENGLIKREESFWDCATTVRDLGLPVDPSEVARPATITRGRTPF